MQKAILLLLFISTLTFQGFTCTGGIPANDLGLIVPTAGYQTILTSNGEWVTVSVTCGNVYNFDFCANGGSTNPTNIFPEISILDVTGVVEHAFSPYSGGCSTLSWTASFTGTLEC